MGKILGKGECGLVYFQVGGLVWGEVFLMVIMVLGDRIVQGLIV